RGGDRRQGQALRTDVGQAESSGRSGPSGPDPRRATTHATAPTTTTRAPIPRTHGSGLESLCSTASSAVSSRVAVTPSTGAPLVEAGVGPGVDPEVGVDSVGVLEVEAGPAMSWVSVTVADGDTAVTRTFQTAADGNSRRAVYSPGDPA